MTSQPYRGMTAEKVVSLLDLEPHPEGGYFRETFRDEAATTGARAASTAIYFLLPRGMVSAWHRVDSAEVWHWYAGAPLELRISNDDDNAHARILGANLAEGERPQAVVPPHYWQSAQSLGAWTLVGCTVAPGFEFDFFELAPEGWQPR